MSAPLSPELRKSLCTLGLIGAPSVKEDAGATPCRRWVLKINDGQLAHRVLLCGGPVLFGSADHCDIIVGDARVEPVHLVLVPHDDGVMFFGGAQGFDCHGGCGQTSANLGVGTPVFLDEFLMLTLESVVDDAS